mgnify:CR=1 FL=1
MEQNYTENTLIRYIYKETNFLENLEVEHALVEEPIIAKAYSRLYNAYKLLPKVTFMPAQNSVDNIVTYSQSPALSN